MPFLCERPFAVVYKGLRLDCGYRVDLVVAVELRLSTAWRRFMMRNFLLLAVGWLESGLLINFNVELLRNGIHPARSRLKSSNRYGNFEPQRRRGAENFLLIAAG